jgi:hypothetical protein
MDAAAEALRLLLSGRTEDGLAVYARVLKGDRLPDVPIGLHLLFLEKAGASEGAAALLEMGLERGADVTVKAAGFGASAQDAAAEYEALFARGFANSRMVYEYLRVLAELGRVQDLRRWLDRQRLLRVEALEAANGSLANDIETVVMGQQESAVHQPAIQSVRDMWMLKDFTALDDTAVAAFNDAVAEATARYLEDWARSDHPLASMVPRDFEIEGWALISKGSGYNIPHVHQQGWATGVYYPTSPAGEGGTLQVGRPEGAAGSEDDWAPATIGPEAGMLVLMPSFYTHWTIPLANPGIRLSVAFDVLPRKAKW